MIYRITPPQSIHSVIQLPPSKSISNRALIINALSFSPYEIENLSDCDDTKVILDAFNSEDNLFDIKGGGTSMRFLTAFLSRVPGEWIITGTERMKDRPIYVLVDALKALGARIEYLGKPGYPPLKIKGSVLRGGEIYLSGDISSQFISALLMIAPTMEKGLTIYLEGTVISVPYIKLTLKMMADFGVKSKWEGNTIKVYPQEYIPTHYKVEADWSSASYWYEIATLCKNTDIELTGVHKESGQGDSKVAELFLDLGIQTDYTENGLSLRKTNRFAKKIFHNFISEPDLAQTFAVTCCMLDIPFLFTGLQSLRIKETDRILALKKEMRKLGYVLVDSDNSILEWDGEKCEAETDPVINTYQDHRMALAFAPASLKLGSIKIENPMAVTKSYPRFWEDLKKVGFIIEEI